MPCNMTGSFSTTNSVRGSIAARDIVAQEAIFAINALDDHVLRATIAQHIDRALDLFNRNILPRVFGSPKMMEASVRFGVSISAPSAKFVIASHSSFV